MALDKQKILSDLGNVMNQLKTADCGCMGKLFGQGQGHRMPSQGYGGCCRQGYGHPCCGEPYTMGEGMPAHGRPCMSYCNAPKPYADGYNFLNQSVMQPVIKEVYDDLRSLNSGNTVTNNPLALQMGLNPGVPTLPTEGNMQNAQMGNMNANPGGRAHGNPMMQHMQAQQMQMPGGHQMSGGMQMAGGQRMNGGMQVAGGQQMAGGQQTPKDKDGLGKFNKMFPGIMQGEGGGLTFNPMEIAMQMNPALAKQQSGMEAPQNPMSGGMGQSARNPMSGHIRAQSANPNTMQPGMNAANLAPNQAAQGYQAQRNTMNQAMPNQPTNQAYAAHTGNLNFPPQGMNQNAQMGKMNANQGGQGGSYGQHTAGISKFKELFPGVMHGLDGDVSFDPMEIAIQMNPSNKQAAAMSSMQKLMLAKPLETNSPLMKPIQGQTQPDQATNQIQQNQQRYATNQIPPNQQQFVTNQIPSNQQYTANQIPANLVYTDLTDNQGNEQVLQQDPNAQNYRKVETPQPMSQGYPYQGPGGRVYEREPILPADNSRFNTIGQPIERLQQKHYDTAAPNLPQTLSPQPVHVKSTISKTSLFARQHGRTASRAQLQQVYNQYKGSQSYTDQHHHLREPVQGHTVSDGRLNAAPPIVEMRQIPVEKVGGDTSLNNQAYNEPAITGGHVVGQVGDVVAIKPAPGNDLIPAKTAKLRNGLQDMVFTSYPQSTAWSFHGRTDKPRHSIRA